MRYIDSHAHLADAAFDADREEVVARARAAGATAIITIGESLWAAERAGSIAASQPGFVYYTAGIHPHDAAQFEPARDLDAIRRHVASGAVAVGECGLDYHYDHSPRELQRRAFEAQLHVARELDVPVVVHTRDSDDDASAMIATAAGAGVRGVLHCFTGSYALATTALDAGWYVSFSGIITFKKWDDVLLLRLVPDDRLLVESDAPYLAPVPFRGKRNEPSFVPRTIERLAGAREVEAHHIAERTADNASRLFGLAVPEPRS
jgi:TatD DNase family protein